MCLFVFSGYWTRINHKSIKIWYRIHLHRTDSYIIIAGWYY